VSAKDGVEIVPFVTESLGDSSYLLVSGDQGVVVDPQRDLRPYLAAAESRGAHIVRAFETHVHNDYISGGPALLALGATVTAPALAKLDFPHQPLNDADIVPVGSVNVHAVATPGHTYEHMAYMVSHGDELHAAFTGGNLLVGGTGRSDLLGAAHTAELTRLQWESGRRLAGMLRPEARSCRHMGRVFCSASERL
jgi:glyoxylase-like metal-dependent hydrolase (beta-lactamase superfamily II)